MSNKISKTENITDYLTKEYKKGNKPKTTQGAKGKSPHNKGKICIYEKNNQRYRGSKRRYITDQQLNEMHAGL